MMLSQKELKIKLFKYLETDNDSLIQISKKINIGYHTLQKFISNKRNLGFKSYCILYEFLNKNKLI